MKSKMKKLVAMLTAVVSLAISSTSISASASTNNQSYITSTSSNWYIRYAQGAPGNRSSYSGTVTNLQNGVDTGVTFVCTGFSDTYGIGYVAKCDIEPNVKLYPNDYAILSYNGAVSTCLFVSNWYSITGSDCNYTVYSAKYINGSYQNYYNTNYPFNISGYAL